MRLAWISGAVYATAAAFSLASVSAPTRAAFRSLAEPYAYAPDLRWPWLWLALSAAVLLLTADVVRRLAAGRKAGMLRYAALLLACAACLGARQALPPPRRATVTDGLAHAIARAEVAADAAFARDRLYPGDADAVAWELPPIVRDLGFRERPARALPVRLVVLPGRLEPLLAPHGRKPGEVVFAVDAARRRYWITAFTLDGLGRVVPFADEAGRVLVASGADGRARSRLDPSFPDYPNKLGAPR